MFKFNTHYYWPASKDTVHRVSLSHIVNSKTAEEEKTIYYFTYNDSRHLHQVTPLPVKEVFMTASAAFKAASAMYA